MSFEAEGMPPEEQPQPNKKNPTQWMWILFGSMVVCGCVVIPVAIGLFLPIFLQARNSAQQSGCMSNLKRLGMAQGLYSVDFDDRLMTSAWMDGLLPYTKTQSVFHCPAADQGRNLRYGYSFDSSAVTKSVSEFRNPAESIIIFDAVPMGRNSVSDLTSAPEPPRHRKNLVLYLDGHAAQAP